MASEERKYLEWFKRARQVFEVGFSEMPEIVQAKTSLAPTQEPVVELHRLTSEKPETWTDVTDQVNINTPGVVDDADEDGTVLLENGAVQFTLEPDPMTETPLPGATYSFFVMANRADDPNLQVAARVWLHIKP